MTKPKLEGRREEGREGVPCAALPVIILCITADTLSRRLGSGWLVVWLRAGCVFIAFFKLLLHRVAVKGIFYSELRCTFGRRRP